MIRSSNIFDQAIAYHICEDPWNFKTGPDFPPPVEKKKNSGKIAAAVIVPLLIIIVGIIVVLFFCKDKIFKKKNQGDTGTYK